MPCFCVCDVNSRSSDLMGAVPSQELCFFTPDYSDTSLKLRCENISDQISPPLSLSLYLSTSSRIDLKVSNSSYGYKLQEAQVILSEVRSIRDAISSGEKEKQELMQVQETERSQPGGSNGM